MTHARWIPLLLVLLTGCDSDLDTDADPDLDPESAPSITTVDAEPAGENCIAGGVAIRTGSDRDGSGTLDATEVASTSYVCGKMLSGNLTIDADADPTAYADLEAIIGDLYVTGSAAAEFAMPALRFVGGTVSITNSKLTAIELPLLRRVVGNIRIEQNPLLETVDLGLLQAVTDLEIADCSSVHTVRIFALDNARFVRLLGAAITTLEISDLRASTLHLSGIRMPSLVLSTDSIGDLSIMNSSITSFYAPQLRSATGLFFSGTELAVLELPKLNFVFGHLEITENPAMTRVSLPVLLEVTRDLRIEEQGALTQLEAPQLLRVERLAIRDNPQLASLAGLAKLESVNSFEIEQNPALVDLAGLATLHAVDGNGLVRDMQLTRLGLPTLRTIARLRVERTPALATLDLPQLREADAVQLFDAPLATDYALPALQVIWSNFTTVRSPHMPTCRAEGLLAALAVPPAVVLLQNTDETAPCD